MASGGDYEALDFESLNSEGGSGTQRFERWIILVTGVHEEAQEDDLQNAFGEFGEIRNLDRAFWGWLFVTFGFVFFMGFIFASVISKLLPLSSNSIVLAIQNDRYYCFLVPLTLTILVVFIYFHWLSMKMFKHA